MKPLTVNKKLLSALAAALVMILGLALVFLLPAKKGAEGRKVADTEIEGVDLTYLSFNKDNEKKLEVKCRESQKAADGRLLMKSITATIFKADKLDKDIHISADSGYTKDDFNDFYLQGHARIVSPSFTLASDDFDLKDMDILSTQQEVAFDLRDVAGKAKKGLLYIFQNKYLKLFQPRGVLTRAGRSYRFRSQVLRVIPKKNILHFDKDAEMDESASTVRGNRISLQFDNDFVNLQSAEAVGQGYFQTDEVDPDGRKHSKEIRANRIKMSNDPQGRLQKIDVAGAGEISLVDGEGSGQVRSEAIEIALNSETQTVETIRALSRGTLTHSGKEKLKVSAESFLATYSKQGVLSGVQADKKCIFQTDDFNGQAESIRYDIPRSTIDISGKNSSVISGKNTFVSGQFQIHTKTRQLASSQSVKATLIPEKKSVLLGAKPLFVTASGMEMSERGKVTRFTDHVSLFQEEIEMHAGELLFESIPNRISCRGNADLKFFDNGEMVTLRGKTVAFDPAAAKIVIEGDARMQQGPNTLNAGRIELAFSRDDKLENIDASEHVTFSKKDLVGKAQLLHWQYTRKTILFKNAAEITRKGAGTTRGQELSFDLDSNEITVSGAADRSETTIRQEWP
jgi:lipopolysaccharide export system protein LptA